MTFCGNWMLVWTVKAASVPSATSAPAVTCSSGRSATSLRVMTAPVTAMPSAVLPSTRTVSSSSRARSGIGVRVNSAVALVWFAGISMSKSSTAS